MNVKILMSFTLQILATICQFPRLENSDKNLSYTLHQYASIPVLTNEKDVEKNDGLLTSYARDGKKYCAAVHTRREELQKKTALRRHWTRGRPASNRVGQH